MKTSCFWLNLLVGLCFRSSFAFPPKHHTQQASLKGPLVTGSIQHAPQQKAPAEEREQVNTVSVTCHPDSLEIIIKADLFGVGFYVRGDELRLGVEYDDNCVARTSSEEEFRIHVSLVDCGTRRWMTEDTLAYTNLLIYSPVASPDGVVRMDEAVIPIECYYERKHSLSSSSLSPTWIPFTSTQTAVETLQFDLRIMTNDWLHERSSNVFYIGEPIAIEASVRVGHHMALRVFVSSCVATLDPETNSDPRYVFIENGCLVDSELPGSRSHFFSRVEDDKLHLTIDAFKFYNEDQGQIYITCHLTADAKNDADGPNKACSLVAKRWRSADGNDYLCGDCQSHNKPSNPGKFGPRGFGKPEEPEQFWRKGKQTDSVWGQDARVGPVMILPAKQQSEPIPAEELPTLLSKVPGPSWYGSQWRSVIKDKVDEGTVQTFEEQTDVKSGTDLEDDYAGKNSSPDDLVTSKPAALDGNGTAVLNDVIPTAPFTVDVTLSNATGNVLSDANDPQT
ncbi:zona pellucida sperm-binding protein 3-like isoform X1 [Pungitius pungitius]|uniref:zona pellucida sperm-binding protein 3-like isoform X1 n=1 Tax=Pungitius pungitius TaxID=134920 RepID=UPI002E10A86B